MTDTPLDAPRLARAQEIFLDTLERAPADRAAWLDGACAGDPAVRAEVDSLLAAHERGGLVGTWEATDPRSAGPQRIGEYRILRQIGEGGMGTVYLAEREGEGFRQRVALKLLRAGWADPRLADRMRHERAILARLEHPGIARLVDGGVTDQGQPFLAMEYVEGTGLLDHARQRQLSVEHRLRLFLQVCDAVHYAHQQLVVHRDLKPGNLMVGPDGRVRLLDFGIATMVDPGERAAGSTQTAAWLTPAYASPEQVRGERVSTLSDVYALGVLLYELLTDVRPYDVDARSPAQVERLVCHTMPARPSARVGAPRRRRELEGDLDTIVLTAMAKEPDRRYGSAAALGDDISRHLEGMPVRARPSRVTYRMRKFVGRHALGVAATALMVVGLGGGILLAGWQARRAAAERDVATREAERAARVSALLVDLFRSSDPTLARGDDVTARELLDRGTERIEREFGDRPDVQAALLSEVAAIYANIGRLDRAAALAERAAALARQEAGGQTLAGSAVLARLGRIYADQGRREEAIATLREAVALRTDLLAEPDTILARAETDLAWELREAGEHEAAADLFRRAMATRRRWSGPGDQVLPSLLLGLASTVHDAGRFAEADSMLRGVLAALDSGAVRPHPMAATALLNLGMLRRIREAYHDAEPMVRAAVTMRRQLFEAGHPERIRAETEWAATLAELADYARAESLLAVNRAEAHRSLGPDHPTTMTARDNLANLLHVTGRYREALALMDTTVAQRRARQGPDHPEVTIALIRHGEPLLALGRLDEAAARFQEAHDAALRTAGTESVYRMLALTGLGRVALARGQHATAEARFDEAAALGDAMLRPGHRYRLALDRERARLDLARGQTAAARTRLEVVLAGERAVRPPGHPRVVETERLLAEARREK